MSTPSNPTGSTPSHTAAIAGGVAGGLAVLIACIFTAMLIWRRRAARAKSSDIYEKVRETQPNEGRDPLDVESSMAAGTSMAAENSLAAELRALREQVQRLEQHALATPGSGTSRFAADEGVFASMKREQTRVVIDDQLRAEGQLRAERLPTYLASFGDFGPAMNNQLPLSAGRAMGNGYDASAVEADSRNPASQWRNGDPKVDVTRSVGLPAT